MTSDLPDDLQRLCDAGQQKLIETDYLAAESLLVRADHVATAARDWDTLSRLYMPLQEARRQRRQRCGEGVVRLDLIATSTDEQPDAERTVADHPHGQLLVAGWASLAPAVRVRGLAAERSLYVETFLAAAYPVGDRRLVVVVPTADVTLPDADVAAGGNVDALLRRLPPFSLTFADGELPVGPRRGSDATFAETMAVWERLHLPFQTAADAAPDPARRVDGYRRAIEVDYAAEKSHQRLSVAAGQLARSAARG